MLPRARFPLLLGKFVFQLHLTEVLLLLVRLFDLFLHLDLSSEILLLELAKLANLHQLGLMTGESL